MGRRSKITADPLERPRHPVVPAHVRGGLPGDPGAPRLNPSSSEPLVSTGGKALSRKSSRTSDGGARFSRWSGLAGMRSFGIARPRSGLSLGRESGP